MCAGKYVDIRTTSGLCPCHLLWHSNPSCSELQIPGWQAHELPGGEFLSLLLISTRESWDHRHMLLCPALSGVWGSELVFSSLFGKHLTYWAISQDRRWFLKRGKSRRHSAEKSRAAVRQQSSVSTAITKRPLWHPSCVKRNIMTPHPQVSFSSSVLCPLLYQQMVTQPNHLEIRNFNIYHLTEWLKSFC